MSLKTNNIEAVKLGPASRCDHERGDIFGRPCDTADKCEFSDPAELMHCAKTGKDYKIRDLDMSCEGSTVRHDNVAAYLAIMRNVCVGHDEIIVAYFCYAAAVNSTFIDGDIFLDDVVITYLQYGIFPIVTDVLGRTTDGGERTDGAAFTYCCIPLYYYVSQEFCAFPDCYLFINNAIGAYIDVIIDPGIFMDDCGRVYQT
jgi:hypothetical protein